MMSSIIMAVSLLGLSSVMSNKPPINSVEIGGTVASIEVIGNNQCRVRVANSSQPGDVYDVLVSGDVCRRLSVGAQAVMTGRCEPVLTVYGFICQPVIERVRRFK